MCVWYGYGLFLEGGLATVIGCLITYETASLWIPEMKADYLRDSTAAGSVNSQPRSIGKVLKLLSQVQFSRKYWYKRSQQSAQQDNICGSGEEPPLHLSAGKKPTLPSPSRSSFLFLHCSSWIINTYRDSVGCQLPVTWNIDAVCRFKLKQSLYEPFPAPKGYG